MHRNVFRVKGQTVTVTLVCHALDPQFNVTFFSHLVDEDVQKAMDAHGEI